MVCIMQMPLLIRYATTKTHTELETLQWQESKMLFFKACVDFKNLL